MADIKNHNQSGMLIDNLMNYKQAAQYLSLSESYLRQLKSQGTLPYVLIGSRSIRFRRSSLDQWAQEREVK